LLYELLPFIAHELKMMNSFVGDWVFYWKPQTRRLDPFRWRGPALVIAVEASIDRATMI
jgi:hypothetical protein